MKKWMNFFVVMLLVGVVTTSCVKNEESEGVKAIRDGYAAQLLANASLASANAAYRTAEVNFKEAEVAAQIITNRVSEVAALLAEGKLAGDLEIAAETLKKELEALATALITAQKLTVDAEAALVTAKKDLANAQAKAAANNPNVVKINELLAYLTTPTTGLYDLWEAAGVAYRDAQVDVLDLYFGHTG